MNLEVLPGESNPNARLTFKQAQSIRKRHADGATITDLAAMYGVGYTTIRYVIIGKRYTEPQKRRNPAQ